MLKVMTVVGTRPEIIRLSATIKLLDQVTNQVLVHTGQNYDRELNQVFFEDLNIREPDYFLNAASKSAVKTIGKIFIELEDIIDQCKPDAFLILGDTNSCLSAFVAKRKKIPIFHVEAGNRCFDQNVPEEINRKIVDNISDINITYSQIAKQHLINEGFETQRVICLGSPMKEVINNNWEKIKVSKILSKLKLKKDKYFVLSVHREENTDSEQKLNKLVELITYLANEYEVPIVLSLHPRTKKALSSKNIDNIQKLVVLPPFSFTDYIALQINSMLVMSDSGTITEEASILGFNAINLRCTHERPEGSEEASVMFTGLGIPEVKNALLTLEKTKRSSKIVSDYEVDNFSVKLVKTIQSYVSYVNRYVWYR